MTDPGTTLTEDEREALDVMGMFPTAAGFADPARWEQETAPRLFAAVERILADRAAREQEPRAEVKAEHVEWGVRWPSGDITSCGWMPVHSEGWARRALHPNERLIRPDAQVGEAVVRRTRTTFADHVTEWEPGE